MQSRILAWLTTLLFIGIASLTALSILSERFLLPALLGNSGLLLGLLGCTRQLRLPVPVLLGVSGLGLMLLITMRITPDPATTTPQVQRVGVGLMLFMAINLWAITRLRLAVMLGGLLSAGSALALLTLILVYTRDSAPMTNLPLPVLSDTVNANVLAGQLVLFLPLALALLLYLRCGVVWWGAVLGGGVVGLLAVAVVSSHSRGATLALVGAMLTVGLGRWQPRLALLGVVSALMLTLTTPFLNQMPELLSQLPLDLRERAEIWQRGWWLLRSAPLTGIGMGTFQAAVDQLYPYLLINPPHAIPHAHHLLLQIGVDLGVLGLGAWGLLYGDSVRRAYTLATWGRQHQHGWAQAIGLGLLGSLSALLLHGALDAVTWGMVRPAPLLWAVWGLGLAYWHGREVLSNSKE